MRVSFGPLTLDTDRRLLLRGGEALHLTPKALLLLETLVAARPRALSKEELFAALWPGTFVSEASLSVLVAELRRALGDRARRPRYLRTVHAYGYAWCGEGVEEGEAAAPEAGAGGVRIACFLQWHRRQVPLAAGENLLGRDPAARVVIDDAAVSRRHARIVVAGGAATLEDLGSKNGTGLNDGELAAPTRLADGDAIRIGPVTLVFHAVLAQESTLTRRF